MAKILQWVNYDGTSYELDGVAYAVCSTASSTSAKVVDSGNDLNFKLINGAKIAVKFTYGISSGSSTLQVGNTSPKVMKYNGALLSPGMIAANQVCEFVYDSTDNAWLLIGGTGTGSSSSDDTSLVFQGTIDSGASLPTNHSIGMVFRVGTAGEYAGEQCEVGDLIVCINEGSVSNNNDWTIVQKNVDVAVFRGTNTFSDGQLLLADGSSGKIKAVNLNPTISITDGTADNAPKVQISVGGASSSQAEIGKATTTVYGTTKLTNTPNSNEQSLAATPKLVDAAIKTLDFTDSADSTKFVSAVNETDGIVSVSRTSFNPSVSIGNGTNDTGPSISISVAGNTSTGAPIPAATTSIYGVTILDDNAYNSSTQASSSAMTPKGVWAAINTLDSDLTGAPAANKTFTAFSQTDGKITGTISDIAIAAGQITSGALAVERGGTGQTSIANIQAGKDASGNTITTTYATKAELSELLNNNNAMLFKGAIDAESDINNSLINYKPGDVYRINTAGTYAGKVCEIGDLLICVNEKISSFNNNDWIVAQANVDGALFKGNNNITDGHMLIASGTNGKVSSVAINTSLTKTASSADDAESFTVSVGGVSSSTVSLGKATTSVYGVTKLTNTPSNEVDSLAATPKLVDSAIAAEIAKLDVSDTIDATKYVSGVSETDGKISVTRNSFSPSIAISSGTADNAPAVSVTVAGQSSSGTAIGKATASIYGVTKLTNTPSATETGLAATPKLVNDAIATGISNISVDDTAVSGQYISEIDQINGAIDITRANFSPAITKTSASADNTDSFVVSVGGASSLSVSLGVATNTVYGVTKLITETSSTTNAYAATPGMVQNAITAKINTLDVNAITAQTGEYISEISETNGIINASMSSFNPSINKTSASGDNTDSFTITVGGATSSPAASLSKATTSIWGVTRLANTIGVNPSSELAATPYAVNEAIGNALTATVYTDTAVTGQYVSEVDQTGGIISVSRESFAPVVTITPTPSNNSDIVPTIGITVGGAQSTPVNIPAATTTAYGVTKLYDGFNSTSTGLAATANSVKVTYDKATESVTLLNSGTVGQMLVATGTSAGPEWKTVGYTALNTGYTITSPIKMTASIENGVLLFTSSSVGIVSSGTIDVVTGFNGVVSSSVPDGNEVSY